MYKKRTLYLLAALLVAEGAAVAAIPSRMPRAGRLVMASLNLAAALAVATIARQKGAD